MENLKEFMPKMDIALVGDKELVVKEMTAAKRDALADVLLVKLDVVKLVAPFIQAYRAKPNEGSVVTGWARISEPRR